MSNYCPSCSSNKIVINGINYQKKTNIYANNVDERTFVENPQDKKKSFI